ncbi:MAG TPA: hypothetical protein VFM41_07670 [Gaiella sp.]|nr:hypothetical protein [Gaiella sp.]
MSARPEAHGEHVLVLVLDEEPARSALRHALDGVPDAYVRLVAPRHVGPLGWFATDEADDHDAAEERAAKSGRTLEPVADVEATEAGELDPVLAVEDALNESPADRIVVLGTADSALEDALRRFGLPVERVGGTTRDSSTVAALREEGRGIMSGRSRATPYAIVVGAALFILAIAVVVYVLAAILL